MMQIRSTRTMSASEPACSIRAAAAGPTACAACGHEFAGGAPLGLRDEEPLCDLCLLEASPQLGLMLALVSVARAYAVACGKGRKQNPEALEELGFFARVYERIAAKSGPMRRFRVPGFTAEEDGGKSDDADR